MSGTARRALIAATTTLLGLGATGCDLVDELLDRGGRAEELRRIAVDELAGPGDRFLGRIGDGPVIRVETVSDTLFRVVVPDDGAPEGEATWQLELTRVEVFPLFPGRDFADYVQERATAVDRRRGLSQEGWSLIADGSVLAVGGVEGEARAVARSGRVSVDRVAFLAPVPGEDEARWSLQPDTRTVLYLSDAVRTAYEGLMYGDDRVMSCAGTAEPRSTPRPVLLECAADVLSGQFASDEE